MSHTEPAIALQSAESGDMGNSETEREDPIAEEPPGCPGETAPDSFSISTPLSTEHDTHQLMDEHLADIPDDWEEMDAEEFLQYKRDLEAATNQDLHINDDDSPFSNWDISRTIDIVENEYIKRYASASGLRLLRPTAIKQAYEKGREVGLVRLFLTNIMVENMAAWTSQRMSDRSDRDAKAVSVTELNAAIGLEIGMSIVQYNAIREYWEDGVFSGHQTFKDAMSRNRFQAIRANLSLRDPKSYDHTQAHEDPLFGCRVLLNFIGKRFAQYAAPAAVSALDECGFRSSARSRAISYLPSKPDKYAVRFYAVVCWGSLYCHSIVFNESGSLEKKSACEKFLEQHKELRTAFEKVINGATKTSRFSLDKKSATSLWTLMLSLQEKSSQSIGNDSVRLVACDNFYTR